MHVVNETCAGYRTIRGVELHIWECIWDDGARTYEVQHVGSGGMLSSNTMPQFSQPPSEEALINLLHEYVGWWGCDGCGARVKRSDIGDVIRHTQECDLYVFAHWGDRYTMPIMAAEKI